MKAYIETIKEDVLKGKTITFEEATKLMTADEDLKTLLNAANDIRKHFVGSQASLCTIINGKSGKCSEDCKFCAQSAHYNTGVDEYEMLDVDEILKSAKEVEAEGVHKFSIVTSGKDLSDSDLEKLLPIYDVLVKETSLDICASHGILTFDQARQLKAVGVKTYHHNVETSKENYENICTTHDYQDRVDTIKACQEADLNVCCGGIFGLGESREDRLKMAFEVKDLNIKSIPLNFLMPIPGTPMALNEMIAIEEILKTLAVFRFINPDSYIRYAGGRAMLEEKHIDGFSGGVNAALVGNYLTTVGSNIQEDKDLLTSLGFDL